MALLETEIMELRTLLKQYQKGKLTSEQIMTQITIYSQIEKRVKDMLMAFMIISKNGKLLTRLTKSNIIGDMSATEITTDYELEKIRCPQKNNEIITRDLCLDHSGRKEDYDICSSCDNYLITRRLLLPESEA